MRTPADRNFRFLFVTEELEHFWFTYIRLLLHGKEQHEHFAKHFILCLMKNERKKERFDGE